MTIQIFGRGIQIGGSVQINPDGIAPTYQFTANSNAALASLTTNTPYSGSYNAISGKPTQAQSTSTTKSFTVESWIKWDNSAANIVGTIIGSPSDTTRQPHFLCVYVDDNYYNGGTVNQTNIRVDGYFLSQTVYPTPFQLVKNTWYHIAVSRDATNNNNEMVWVNGVACGGVQTDSRIYSSNSLTLSNGWPNPQNYKKFVGFQADVRVVSNAYVYNPTLTTITVPTAPLSATVNASSVNTVALIQADPQNTAVDNSPIGQTLEFAGIRYTSDTPYSSGGTGSWFNIDGNGTVLMNPGVYNC
jgi:hypothetical protein